MDYTYEWRRRYGSMGNPTLGPLLITLEYTHHDYEHDSNYRNFSVVSVTFDSHRTMWVAIVTYEAWETV